MVVPAESDVGEYPDHHPRQYSGHFAPEDIIQLAAIGFISMAILLLKWKDLMVTFFDEHHARSIGLNTRGLKLLFFTLLAACTVGGAADRRRLSGHLPGGHSALLRVAVNRSASRACWPSPWLSAA